MSFDGNGNWNNQYSAVADEEAGLKILASRFDNILLADIKSGFEKCVTTDSQTLLTRPFNVNSHRIINVSDAVNATDAVNKGQAQDMAAAIGDLKASLQPTNHSGWILCDGQEISRTRYADLFALIGTTFGDGDHSTTFNVPNLSGRFLQMKKNGQTVGQLVEAGLPKGPSHTHFVSSANNSNTALSAKNALAVTAGGDRDYTLEGQTYGLATIGLSSAAEITGGVYGASDTVQPPAMTVHYFIKAKWED